MHCLRQALSKHNEASLSTILTDLLCLWVAQMPRYPDLAIFVHKPIANWSKVTNGLGIWQGTRVVNDCLLTTPLINTVIPINTVQPYWFHRFNLLSVKTTKIGQCPLENFPLYAILTCAIKKGTFRNPFWCFFVAKWWTKADNVHKKWKDYCGWATTSY